MRLAHPLPQRLGNNNAAISLLIVFEDRDQRPAHGDRGAIESVDKLRSFFTLFADADIQPPRLVVSAIAGAGHFAKLAGLAAAGHPSLQIELAISRSAQIAARRID